MFLPFTGCLPSQYLLSSSGGGAFASHLAGGCRRSSSPGTQRFSGRGTSDFNVQTLLRNGFIRSIDDYYSSSSKKTRNYLLAAKLRAMPDHAGSLPDPLKQHCYHPFEEIQDPVPLEDGEDVRLTDAETAKTIIEVNCKATLMFSRLIDDEVHENIFWPDLSYLTDENGDIYFEVNNDEDILQTLTADDNLVQVIIGLDNIEMLSEMEVAGQPDIDFGMEEITSEDNRLDDDYEGEDFVGILEDEEDDMVSYETLGDWADFETMHSSHPMYFAKKIAEVVSNIHLDWMDQPSAGIVIQGLLRPAFIEEHSIVRKHPPGHNTNNDRTHLPGEVVESDIEEELAKDESLQSGTAFYKLEMINIQLVSPYGNQSVVNVQEFRKARPDIIAHSAVNIISRVKVAGEKTIQAFKSLCWKQKGIVVEEAALTGVDSLGFDLRVCSGTQVQTLRFGFNTRATSEYSAERQIHDLLFPRTKNKHKWQQAHQKEC